MKATWPDAMLYSAHLRRSFFHLAGVGVLLLHGSLVNFAGLSSTPCREPTAKAERSRNIQYSIIEMV